MSRCEEWSTIRVQVQWHMLMLGEDKEDEARGDGGIVRVYAFEEKKKVECPPLHKGIVIKYNYVCISC